MRFLYRYFYLDIYYKVKYFFNSPHKWLYRTVPKTRFSDKFQIVEDVLYAAIVDFVEVERCFEFIDWGSSSDEHKKVAKFIQDCYDWIKIQKPKFEVKKQKIIDGAFKRQSLEEMIEDLKNVKSTYEERYPGLRELEKEMKDRDEYYLSGIVKYREYLWV